MQRFLLYGASIPLGIVLLALWGLHSVAFSPTAIGLSVKDTTSIAIFSLMQASLSTVGAVVLGIPFALMLHRQQGRTTTFIRLLFDLIIIAPVLVVILSLAVVYGNNGWIQFLFGDNIGFFYGLSGILLGHIFFNAPLVARFVETQLRTLPAQYVRLSMQLDFNARARFRHLYWPITRNALVQVVPLVFTLCFTSFAIVLIMGANPIQTTIEVAIYQALKYDFAVRAALWLTFLQMALLICMATIWFSLFSRNQSSIPPSNRASLSLTSTGNEMRFDTLTSLIALLMIVPVALALISRGINSELLAVLTSKGFWSALVLSISIGATAALLCTAAAYMIVIGVRTDKSINSGLFSLTALLIPSLLLAMGVFLTLRHSGNLALSGWFAVCFITAIKSLPFAIVLIQPYAANIRKRYDRLANQLDLGPGRYSALVLRPLLSRHLVHAFMLTSILSLGDFSTIALFGSEDLRTLPYLIYQYYGNYRSNEAYALSLILFVIIALYFYATSQQSNEHTL